MGMIFGLFVHLSIIYAVKNRAFNHVIDASSSSWLQEHVTDMSERYELSRDYFRLGMER